MKALVQRVSQAKVEVDGKTVGEVEKGLLVLLGVSEGDTEKDTDKLAEKLPKLRIFEDDESKMNLSLLDVEGEILLVSQFTLCARTDKGNRPSFVDAAGPDLAKKLYQDLKTKLQEKLPVKTGKFGAFMDVKLTNSGPVTIMLDTKE